MRAGEEQVGRLPIVQYWHEEVVPDDIEEMFATFQAHNHDFRHLAFSESTAGELIAGHFGSREVEAFRSCAVPAMQADYFRYCVVYALGGIYCDADSRCIGSLRPLVEAGGGEIFEGPEKGHARNECFAFSSPGHPLLRLSVDIATTNIEHRAWDRVWIATGPWIFKELLRAWRSGSVEDGFKDARSNPRFENDPRMLLYLQALREIVGDDARIAHAFEGVRVSPLAKMERLVVHARSHFAYKDTDLHFPNFKSSIYR